MSNALAACLIAVVALMPGAAGARVGPPRDLACSKCPPPDAARTLAEADVVFVGRAVDRSDGGDSVFAVERVFKGQVPARVTVRAGGVKYAMLPPPERYLVYAALGAGPGEVDVRTCGGSGLASALGPALRALGKGRPPGARLVSGKTPARRRAACLAKCRRRAMTTHCMGDEGLMPCPCSCP